MARYEHLPIYRAAFDLAVHLEKIVKNFTRYQLRDGSRRVLQRIIEANEARDTRDRAPALDGMKIRRSAPGSVFEQQLWRSGAPVGWIGETGRRLADICERALMCRWAGARSVACSAAGSGWD